MSKDTDLVVRMSKTGGTSAKITGQASLKGISLAYVDGGGGDDTITDSENRFVDAGFVVGQTITTANSTTAGNDLAAIVLTDVVAGTLSFATGSLVGGVSEAFVAATTLVNNASTGYSKPIEIGRLSGNPGSRQLGAPTEIGFVISSVVNGIFTGNFQACNAQDDADFAESSDRWQDIDGGNLATWPTGGASAIFAPYTHIRSKVEVGSAEFDLASTTPISEV